MKNNIEEPSLFFDAAFIAQEAGKELCSRLDLIRHQPEIILDMGFCGELLKSRYSNAQVISCSSHLSYLQHMQQKNVSLNYLCGDMQSLAIKKNSVDLIIANFILPWCGDLNNLKTVMSAWLELLRPGGLLMFSTLGPGSLVQFPSEILNIQRIDMHDIGDAILSLKYADPVLDSDYLMVRYQKEEKLISDLWHAGIILSQTPAIKFQVNMVIDYEIIYGHAWAPQELEFQENCDDGSTKIPISVLRNALRASHK